MTIAVIPIAEIPEISAGDDLAAAIVAAAEDLHDGDVVVVAQKVVSKAEGRVVEGDDRRAAALAEATRILRSSDQALICETRGGLVCANAGIDASNVPIGHMALLPLDPDLSARRLRARIRNMAAVDVGVVISDTFGRAWRLGQTNVAIGVAGFAPFADYRGTEDSFGRELNATRICVADELAGAAELVMKKTTGICAAIVRGADVESGRGTATEIARPASQDLFR